jgi:hypothetical protein
MSDYKDIRVEERNNKRYVTEECIKLLEENNIDFEINNNLIYIKRVGLKNMYLSASANARFFYDMDDIEDFFHKWRYEGENKWKKVKRKNLIDLIKGTVKKPSLSENTSISKYDYNMSILEPILKKKGYVENVDYQISDDKTKMKIVLKNDKIINVILNKKKADYVHCSYGTDTIYTYGLLKFKSLLDYENN